MSAQGSDLGFDDIETDAAAGNVGYFIRRAEAGCEDQHVHFVVAQVFRFFCRHDSAFDRRFQHLGTVYAFAVFFDLDEDVIAAVKGAKMNGTDFRLADLDPFGIDSMP